MGAERTSSGGSWTRKWSLKSLLSGGSSHGSQVEQTGHSSGDLAHSVAYLSEGIAQDQDRHSFTKHHSGEFMPDEPSIFARAKSAASLFESSMPSAFRSRPAAESPFQAPSQAYSPDRHRPSTPEQQPRQAGRHSRARRSRKSEVDGLLDEPQAAYEQHLRPPPRPRPKDASSILDTPSRYSRPGFEATAALLDTPLQQPSSLLQTARGVFDTGAAPTYAAYSDAADSAASSRQGSANLGPGLSRQGSANFGPPAGSSRQGSAELRPTPEFPRQGSGEVHQLGTPPLAKPLSSRHSSGELAKQGGVPSRQESGELRPYPSPFAKPPSLPKPEPSSVQTVGHHRSHSAREGPSVSALQKLPMHTGQSPVRPSPGMMKASARAQSDFAAMAAQQPAQPAQHQLPSPQAPPALPEPERVGCFGMFATRSKSSPAALEPPHHLALPAPETPPRLQHQPPAPMAIENRAHDVMTSPPSQLAPLRSEIADSRTPLQHRHRHSTSAASLASEGSASRRLHSNYGSQSTFERAGSSASAASQSPLSDDEGEQAVHDSVTSLRQRKMAANDLHLSEAAQASPEASPLTKACLVGDLWSSAKPSPARSSPGSSNGKEVETMPQWVINPYEIAFCSMPSGKLCRLGSGAFGTVYRGVFRGQSVAVKVCKHSQVEQTALRCFQREVSILYNSRHPNILEFIGACTWRGGQRTVLLTTFMEKGDLYAALGRSPVRYSWHHYGQRIALDVARGLAYLHSRHIVHFDLKSANILLDNQYHAKIADVGLSKTLTQYHDDSLSTYMATSDIGTFSWSAPEVLLGLPCTPKADVYSFGVVLWELATCEIPVGRDMPPIRVPDDGPRELYSLILQCMQHDPARRPDSAELVTLLEGMQLAMPRLAQAPRLTR